MSPATSDRRQLITSRPSSQRKLPGVWPDSAVSTSACSVRVLVAERKWFVREALASVFSRVSDLDLIGKAETAERALELVERLEPEVAFVDPHLPVMGGLELARRLRDEHPRTAVVLLTNAQNENEVVEALRAGVSGYVVAGESDPLRICEMVRLIAGGATLLTARNAHEIISRLARAESCDPAERFGLTPREREVLDLVGNGLANRQIADSLFITERSVKNHVRNIFLKLGVANRTSAAILARSHGLAGTH